MISYNKKYLLRLKKRRDFLANRTSNRLDLSFDIAEMKALSWAIDVISDIYNIDELGNRVINDYEVEIDELRTH